jgi:transposase InsO family protein
MVQYLGNTYPMYMAYSKNPHLPRVRMDAVKLVRAGWSYRKVARHTGFTISAISKWMKKADSLGHNQLWIPTQSSQPRHHPNELPSSVVEAIVQERAKRHRCAEVVHEELKRQGIVVSLSSVKRTLDREGLLKKRSPWKRPHDATPRPVANLPGDLVEIDTIHILTPERFYVYTLLDVCTRWAYAAVVERIRVKETLLFVREAKQVSPFPFHMLQSDHGSEFSQGFTLNVGTQHRHSRVRTPNDNAHLERFNRTLQEECLDLVRPSIPAYQKAIDEYLPYYNNERLHMGLNYETPLKRFQAIEF